MHRYSATQIIITVQSHYTNWVLFIIFLEPLEQFALPNRKQLMLKLLFKRIELKT